MLTEYQISPLYIVDGEKIIPIQILPFPLCLLDVVGYLNHQYQLINPYVPLVLVHEA